MFKFAILLNVFCLVSRPVSVVSGVLKILFLLVNVLSVVKVSGEFSKYNGDYALKIVNFVISC